MRPSLQVLGRRTLDMCCTKLVDQRAYRRRSGAAILQLLLATERRGSRRVKFPVDYANRSSSPGGMDSPALVLLEAALQVCCMANVSMLISALQDVHIV